MDRRPPLGDVTNSTNLGYGRGRKRLRVETGLAPLVEEENVASGEHCIIFL
jgi:hypothetical protein